MVKGEDSSVYQKLMAQFNRVAKPSKQKPTGKRWKYHVTMPYKDFLKPLGVELKFATSESTGCPYGYFIYHGRFIVVGISRFIKPDAIPGDAEISICSTPMGPHNEIMERRYLLLLHRFHKLRYPETGKIIQEYYLSPPDVAKTEPKKPTPFREEDLPPDLRAIVARLRKFLPDLEITDISEEVEPHKT